MGQAKARGSFEERKAAAVAREEERQRQFAEKRRLEREQRERERAERRAAEQARIDVMTPEERDALLEARRRPRSIGRRPHASLLVALALAAAAGGLAHPRPIR